MSTETIVQKIRELEYRIRCLEKISEDKRCLEEIRASIGILADSVAPVEGGGPARRPPADRRPPGRGKRVRAPPIAEAPGLRSL